MAVITSAAIGLATAGMAIYQGQQAKKDAKKALEALETPSTDNAYEGIQISTAGTELRREENQSDLRGG